MKKEFVCFCLILLSMCIFIACGGDDESPSNAASPRNDAISGLFQINSKGTKVCFAPGNLQATYNGTTWNWAFSANQWDYIGERGANISVEANGTASTNGTIDLFGWVGESSTWTGAAQYGISSSNTVNSSYTYGNKPSEALKSDWGNTISDGYTWRTLSWSEWTYVFNTRSGSTVNGTANARYTYATINTDDRAVNGIILFPDGITVEGSAATWGGFNSTSWSGAYSSSPITECTSAQWSNLAAKGCVFLPAAGYRYQSSVRSENYGCYYWSSSSNPSEVYYAYAVVFDSYYLSPAKKQTRPDGCSVRLVREVE